MVDGLFPTSAVEGGRGGSGGTGRVEEKLVATGGHFVRKIESGCDVCRGR